MNIVVTIPKDRLADVEREEADLKKRLAAGENAFYFWALARWPKQLRVGDRMYFVWDGAVRAFHYVTGFKNDMTCETTGRKYKGCCVLLDPAIHEIVPFVMKGFRGYQYFTAPVCEKGVSGGQER
jgi:hypothetical protein